MSLFEKLFAVFVVLLLAPLVLGAFLMICAASFTVYATIASFIWKLFT